MNIHANVLCIILYKAFLMYVSLDLFALKDITLKHLIMHTVISCKFNSLL